jgi:hypothetical protein
VIVAGKAIAVFKKALPWLGTLAGIAGSAVPGVGPLLSIGSKILADKLKTSVPATADGIQQALQNALGDPAQQAQLQEAELAYKQALQAMNFQHEDEQEQIAAGDTADARAREVATHDWYPKVLASLVVAACLSGECFYFHYGTPSNVAPELIGRILGTLDNALILVLGYYFGSSVSSRNKDSTIAALSK